MKTVSLSGSPRESVGKKDAKKQRREGKVPCVLYGGEEQVHFTVDALKFDKLIFTTDVYLINISVDGKEYQAILQDVQFHPVTDRVLHADFLLAKPGQPIIIGLPVRFEGNVPGVMAGGRLIKKMRKVVVKGQVDDMPDFITVDMSNLHIGDSIKVKDLETDKFVCMDHKNAVVVLVKTARGAEELEEEEEEEEGVEAEGGAPAEEKPAEE
jgi:large subunit ribosomal protein L25